MSGIFGRLCVGILIAGAGPIFAAAPSAALSQQNVVQKYCAVCHNDRTKTGGLVLNNLDPAHSADNPEI
ncbi:MAG: hypothetical protein JOZ32_15920 [Bryobacterales bacterium]|nr:hypothetical protein [Bryobacterales bacterium]